MGRWFLDDNGKWAYDSNAESEPRDPALTYMQVIVPPSPVPRAPAGENDALVERTFNGLRGDDLALEQPPQSPAWTPSDDT